MAIEITDFRLSFIWALTLLSDKKPPDAKFGQRFGYAPLFDEAQKSAASGSFSVPWPLVKPYAHRFWVNYLGAGNPGEVDGKTAWSKGVPLRATKPLLSVSAAWFPGRISVEHYFHPFGAALVVTFAAPGAFKENEWVDLVVDIERRGLDVALGGEAAVEMNLTALAGASLRKVRKDYFSEDTPEPQLPTPFTIATIISGSGVNPADVPKEGDAIHRMLYGAATRSPTYRTAVLEKLAVGDTLLNCRRTGAAPGDVVFATKRGRVVWFPSSFTKVSAAGKPVTSLSCYHRNQYFAALQVESLCSLTRALTSLLDAKRDLPQWIIDFEKLPAQMLADMYEGDATKTYRSASVPRQIDDNGVKNSIAKLRQRAGLPQWPRA